MRTFITLCLARMKLERKLYKSVRDKLNYNMIFDYFESAHYTHTPHSRRTHACLGHTSYGHDRVSDGMKQ